VCVCMRVCVCVCVYVYVCMCVCVYVCGVCMSESINHMNLISSSNLFEHATGSTYAARTEFEEEYTYTARTMFEEREQESKFPGSSEGHKGRRPSRPVGGHRATCGSRGLRKDADT
jgi:hypothetical protein